eukprot:COSAG02_NODE_88_length_38629_cov_457.967999_10_plen_477_part_00
MLSTRRSALEGWRIGALKKEARSAGVDMKEVDEAIDEADDPKAALIELILDAYSNPEPEPEPETTPEPGPTDEARRAALALMRIRELKEQAQAAGVDMKKVEEAIDDAVDPKAAVTELILTTADTSGPKLPAQKSVPLMLSKVPLLMHLSAPDKERIREMLQVQDFAAEATIISQGDIEHDSTSFMYFMENGEAIATVDGVLSTRYERGSYFGELALLNKAPRKATVCAGLAGARCLKLSRSDFRTLEFNEAMLQAQQDLYNSITDKLSVKRKSMSSTQKLEDQHRSLADRHFGTLRGMGAGMLKLLGSDASTDGGTGKLRSLSDVVEAEKAGLNTPVFVAALTQNKHDDDSILKVRGRVLAAINAGKSMLRWMPCIVIFCVAPFTCTSCLLFTGHRPNMCTTTNRDAIAGLWTLYHYYHTTIMGGAERTRDGARGQESERGLAALPPAFQMKVALAAGLPRTLVALRGLFRPQRV